jgi:amidohydrolase
MTMSCLKSEIFQNIDSNAKTLSRISDTIFNDPEPGYEEFHACETLGGFLKAEGFDVETGYAGLPTAFRAIWRNNGGGSTIGLLCEYDALPMGHGCAHHLQGPACIGAALAVKDAIKNVPYTIEVIGTPAEEIGSGGKSVMIRNGAFKELDLALMMHGADACTVDVKSIAYSEFAVAYRGTPSHSAIAPEKGRSALDAVMLASTGIAYLRGHVADDVRMSMIVEDGGSTVNVVPEKASARVELRSYSRPYLDSVIERAKKVFEGAAMMTETTCEINKVGEMHNKIPVPALNELLMDNARAVGAKSISPPREKTGSTDFASVMHMTPGACVRVAFVDKGVPAHSDEFLKKGDSDDAHEALLTAAKILAATCADVLTNPENMKSIRNDFEHGKQKSESEGHH